MDACTAVDKEIDKINKKLKELNKQTTNQHAEISKRLLRIQDSLGRCKLQVKIKR